MEKLKQEMLDKKVWAVVGATPTTRKFGYKIWKILKDNGYEVYAINPRYEEIDGDKCYSSLKELPKIPEVVDFVVPPALSIKVIDEAKELGIKNLWFQPGTADEKVLDKAEKIDTKFVYLECVLAELK